MYLRLVRDTPALPTAHESDQGGRDSFDVVAEFIFQVRASSDALDPNKLSNRNPTLPQYCYIIVTFKTFSKCAFVSAT